jgi:hypothetical protein
VKEVIANGQLSIPFVKEFRRLYPDATMEIAYPVSLEAAQHRFITSCRRLEEGRFFPREKAALEPFQPELIDDLIAFQAKTCSQRWYSWKPLRFPTAPRAILHRYPPRPPSPPSGDPLRSGGGDPVRGHAFVRGRELRRAV